MNDGGTVQGYILQVENGTSQGISYTMDENGTLNATEVDPAIVADKIESTQNLTDSILSEIHENLESSQNLTNSILSEINEDLLSFTDTFEDTLLDKLLEAL